MSMFTGPRGTPTSYVFAAGMPYWLGGGEAYEEP